ncbi:beta-ketoacyl-[acyl-carrier-protein] synthase II [Aliivibrio fischeri]|uniref:beta-ketoacyl-[acyl-carrier-protein] synthase family protein n=1 Tax=Aliivibrio fischeri TaxID=668 RepID=UPI0003101C72|nr:beta-ketoacyl-[acyl-carrier-protein] synthase family protein [Aliivibrio fischeri]OCH03316.1 beta-ketoacyl-[acyl-carrier-protein] synthase II [Aliivibrio fischeri]OCH12619.1 beta-ketoacyl-[acyl-carrier-protein] synthase II [Aliivibrio fischeri]OCH38538.1 beta-ketoacyl-[acyl-carrier-protein] synthase II [Aliivibrio fischeri]OCH61500.1 beta-ketoacyl-[acyl-carrier-protein] synthase II [Aliivibrio fischeri]OEE10180.1 beta-ketoacyl-[acyl-carrier-protein] synthase II [Aliivibrio fischeri ZF-211]
MSDFPLYIHACGSHSAMGKEVDEIHQVLSGNKAPSMHKETGWLNDGKATVVGKALGELPLVPEHLAHWNTRNNQLVLSALQQIEPQINAAKEKYGSDRIAVIVGTSTSGISDGEVALKEKMEQGVFPAGYSYKQQELGNPADFIAQYLNIDGPTYAISTACSSSGRIFLSAKRLLKAGFVDAVIVGGTDSLCRLTLNGFNSLEALSNEYCLPFSPNRKGINIGEASAYMLLSAEQKDSDDPIALLGAGDSSDAHHISAPHPEGKGAIEAMNKALNDAGLTPEDIGYINAHGTATPLNDAMESKAVHAVFGDSVPVSSTKPLTGHTLGAAGIIEASICWHILKYNLPLPKQINDGHKDDALADIQLVVDQSLRKKAVISNSFAFGGNNISLIFGCI